MPHFGNLLTAMVTPMDAELNVDYQKARKLARKLVREGSDGLVVCGTTGESPTLTHDEKLKLFEEVLSEVGEEAIIVAGTGSNSTESSITLTREAERIGVHGVMLVGPYYNKPPQEALYQHFRAVAEETSLPVLLYNVPGRTSRNIEPDTVIRLSQIENIVAIKEASGNLDQVSKISMETPEDFDIYSGEDSLTLPILSVGGVGIVSVAAHVVGRQMKEMITAYLAGDVKKAKELHLRLFPVFKAVFVTTNPIPVKVALKLTGFDAGGLRLPLIEASEKEIDVIKEALAKV